MRHQTVRRSGPTTVHSRRRNRGGRACSDMMLAFAAHVFVACGPPAGEGSTSGSQAVGPRSQLRENADFAKAAKPVDGYGQIGAVDRPSDGDLLLFVEGRRLLRATSDGTTRASAERIGGGPGEWRYVRWAGRHEDRAALIDLSSLRYPQLDRERMVVHETIVPAISRLGEIIGRLDDGSMISPVGLPVLPGFGYRTYTTHVVRWTAGRPAVDPLLQLGGTEMFMRASESISVPLPGGHADWGTAAGSTIVVGNGSSDTVKMFDQTDGRWRSARLAGLPIATRMTREPIDQFIDVQVGVVPKPEARRRMRRTSASVRSRSETPRFEHLLLDDRGVIWCGGGTSANTRWWYAFTPDGRQVDSIALTRSARLRLVRDQDVIATTSDDDSLQRVAKYERM